MHLRPFTLPIVALALSCSAFAEDSLWTDNFEKAKQTAAADKKDLLIDFTGSDWCGWCIKLRKEVFDQEAFKAAAPKDFVLVELDFPRDTKKLGPGVQEQNKKLQQEFQVSGFPTIYLADAAGRPYARTGYQQGGPEAYLKNLENLRAIKTKRDEAWKAAESAQGVEKAKLLAKGLALMDESLAPHYTTVLSEIASLDPKDETGISGKFTFKTKLQEVAKAGGDGAALRKEADAFVASHPNLTPEEKQKILLTILQFCRPPRDSQTVETLAKDVQALAPESDLGKKAGMLLAQVQAMMKKDAEKAAKAAEQPGTPKGEPQVQ